MPSLSWVTYCSLKSLSWFISCSSALITTTAATLGQVAREGSIPVKRALPPWKCLTISAHGQDGTSGHRLAESNRERFWGPAQVSHVQACGGWDLGREVCVCVCVCVCAFCRIEWDWMGGG